MSKTIKPEHIYNLAVAHEKLGKWSSVVSSKIPIGNCNSVTWTFNDIDTALKGSGYFEHGIKPHFANLDTVTRERLEFDPVTALRKLYGVSTEKAYSYCDLLDLSLPIAYKYDDLGRELSDYHNQGYVTDNDCAIRSLSALLNWSYDYANDVLLEKTGNYTAETGIDQNELKKVCGEIGLTHVDTTYLFKGRSIANTSPYELFTMVPELRRENFCILVYRHVFYVSRGVALDVINHLHHSIYGLICLPDSFETIRRKIKNGLSTSPIIKDIAYERWTTTNSWEKIAFNLRMKKEGVRTAADSPEYMWEIQDLMFNWRSKDEFIHWITTYHSILSRLSRRLGLSEDDVESVIRNVQARHGISELKIP